MYRNDEKNIKSEIWLTICLHKYFMRKQHQERWKSLSENHHYSMIENFVLFFCTFWCCCFIDKFLSCYFNNLFFNSQLAVHLDDDEHIMETKNLNFLHQLVPQKYVNWKSLNCINVDAANENFQGFLFRSNFSLILKFFAKPRANKQRQENQLKNEQLEI